MRGIMLLAGIALSGCSEVQEAAYTNLQAAKAAGAIERGWIPEWMPQSSTNLREAHNLDTNRSSLSLRFSADERWSPPANCQSIGPLDAPVPRIRLRWWPSDVPPSSTMVQRHTYFSCSDKNEFVAVSSADGELLYWRAGGI